MLCPEVSNFPPPKIISSNKQYENLKLAMGQIKMNNFYKSIIVTCPDEIRSPSFIENIVTEDNDYYKFSNCSLTEFMDGVFIENFVKNGNLYCLTADTNCVVQNCAAITPDGMLTLHVIDFIYQTLGLEGTRRPLNYYEVIIDLKNLVHLDKVRRALSKLQKFDFYVMWEPNREDVCPSSIAKYFFDKNIHVSVCTPEIKAVNPAITEIPCFKDVDVEDIVEWLGMLAHDADLSPTEAYISAYSQPESEHAIKSSRISVLIAKGFFTPTTISNVCEMLDKYVSSRELDGYWAAASVQSYEDSVWRWSTSTPRMFQSHNSSSNIFITHSGVTVYTIGQLKYS